MLMSKYLSSPLLALALMIPAAPSAASSGFDTSLVTNRICAGAPELSAASSALRQNGISTANLAGTSKSIILLHSNGKITVGLNDGTSLSYAGTVPAPTVLACVAATSSERLSAHNNQIPIEYIAAFTAVEAFRQNHVWPLGAANLDDPSTGAIVESYTPRYYIVIFADSSARQAGNENLGCAGIEYYRVDAQTLVVSPYDGCVEGHQHLLPAFSALPG
jgi:hypothetical protein